MESGVAAACHHVAAINPEFEASVAVAAGIGGDGNPLLVLATVAAAILCHEAGHFFCARSVGLRAEEFSVGFGPEVLNLGRDAGGTEFILRLLPVGGYVRFDEERSVRLPDGSMVNEFESMPAPQRLWVLSGGVVANMITAWLSLTAAAVTLGVPKKEPLPGVRIESVAEEALERTGLQISDVLMRIGQLDLSEPGQSVRDTVDFIKRLPSADPVELLVNRGGESVLLKGARLITDPLTGASRLGVMINSNTEKVVMKAASLGEAAQMSADTIARLVDEQLVALQNILSGAGAGAEVLGPVGIVKQGEDMASTEGLVGLGLFFVSVNLNLAVLNALPIPALDGGKVVFVLAEQLLGRRLDEDKKNGLELLFILLVLLSVASLTVKDVAKIFLPK